MKQLTPKQASLVAQWSAIDDGAGQGISWLESTRASSVRLDSEADNIVLQLHRARNTARILRRASQTPMGIGFFGLSQAGKSYLISALAANESGKLETRYNNESIDFLTHVNPTGGGKEATGLVTRFTRQTIETTPGYPIVLQVFREIEIAKILVNAYFNDFNHQIISYELDEERIQKLLTRFDSRRRAGPEVPGVNAGDVVDLWDYAQSRFGKYLRKLESVYWRRAVELAPQLNEQERAQLFAILWDDIPQLTQLYVLLASTLRDLGHPETVQAPLDALVTRAPDGLRQVDNIMNVDTLSLLGTPGERRLQVTPMTAGQPGKAVSVPIGQLTALTAELTFPLDSAAADPDAPDADLLDFPGYRARLKLLSLDEPSAENRIPELILRGKVAYLFERYTDNQEMNGLVICTASDKQSDVTEVGAVLSRWIAKTQGATPEERAQRDAGLIWAITMMDKRIASSLQHNESQLMEGWDGLIKMTMLERFADQPWMQQWTSGQPFNNTYLVRKPRMATPFLKTLAHGEESGIIAEQAQALARMESTFPKSTNVNAHIHEPAHAWASMMRLNDGGMERIKSHLKKIATLDFKLARLEEQLRETRRVVLQDCLQRWHHQQGGDEANQKKEIAHKLWKGLGAQAEGLAELITYMALPRETLRDIYLSGAATEHARQDETEAEADAEEAAATPSLYATASPFGAMDADSPFGSSPFGWSSPQDTDPAASPAPKTKGPELQGVDHRYARAVFSAWTAHMRQLPQRPFVKAILSIDKELAEAAIDEIITAASRLKLQERLTRALLARTQSGARRDQLVERQASIAHVTLSDFLSWLGYLEMPLEKRPNSPLNAPDKLFIHVDGPAPDALPELDERPVHHARVFQGDWLMGLATMTTENAGHNEGREISIEQNEKLGRILRTVSGEH